MQGRRPTTGASRAGRSGALKVLLCAALFAGTTGSGEYSSNNQPASFQGISLEAVRPFVNNLLQGNGTMLAAAGTAWGIRTLRQAAEKSKVQERVAGFFNQNDAPAAAPFQAVTTDASSWLPTTLPTTSWLPTTLPTFGPEAQTQWAQTQWMPAEWMSDAPAGKGLRWMEVQRGLRTEWEEASKGMTLPPEWVKATEGFTRAKDRASDEWRQTVENFQDLHTQARQQWRNGEQALQVRVSGLEHKLEQQVRGIRRSGSFAELRGEFAQRLEDSALDLQRRWEEASPLENIVESTAQRLKAWQDKVTTRIDTLRMAVRPVHRHAEMRTTLENLEAVRVENQALHDRLFGVLHQDGWEHVLTEDGVKVYRKKMLDVPGGEKFYCIKAVGVIKAKANDVYDLLKDASRVEEYNDECEDIQELQALSEDTRVTWASSKTYFPFKPREVITRVHNTQLKDGTYVIMSKSEDVDSPDCASNKDFVRTDVLLAGNVMRPCADDPTKTEFTTIAHINPGGAAETHLGAQITNRICTHGPVSFIRKLEQVTNAAKKLPI